MPLYLHRLSLEDCTELHVVDYSSLIERRQLSLAPQFFRVVMTDR